MSFGLETLGMASGAGKSLEDILSERRADALMQMKGLETLNAQRLNQDYHDQMIQARQDAIEQRRQAAQDAAEAKAETARRLGEAQVEKNVSSMVPGDVLPLDRFQKMSDAGGISFPISRFQKIDEQAPVDVGPLQQGQTSRAGHPGGMQFLGTQPQLQKISEDTARQQNAQDKLDLMGRLGDIRNDIAQQRATAAQNKPPQLVPVTTVENGRPVLKFVPKVEGATYEKPPNATTENRLSSAQAVNQTGNDIIAKLSDPEIAAKVGPIMGRYNSVRDWVGNPPPELAELAGAIESYSLANMGVHGMRSAQGAEKIKQLLDQKHTPESLIATIRGLKRFSTHFMENEGRGQATGGSTGGLPNVGDTFNGQKVLKVEKVQD